MATDPLAALTARMRRSTVAIAEVWANELDAALAPLRAALAAPMTYEKLKAAGFPTDGEWDSDWVRNVLKAARALVGEKGKP